jgi:NosR/NirI family nitrous oxide reductase transcriptional regulator
MVGWLRRYTRWLHTGWPAGAVEKLPRVQSDGSTNVPGLYVIGDLAGVPLLKLSADAGARLVRTLARDPGFQKLRREEDTPEVHDLVILGAGVAGMAAALEARNQGLEFVVLESAEPFATIVNFPRRKPIFTYPAKMTPAGDLRLTADVKEDLLHELREQTLGTGIEVRHAQAEHVRRSGKLLEVVVGDGAALRARRVIVAIGRTGNFRKLEVPGEDLDHVTNRLHDPADFAGQDVLVVGGGDSAVETAVALARSGAHVTLSYRRKELSRPKEENLAALQALAADPSADVQMEEPVSGRVTTSAGTVVGSRRRRGTIHLALATQVRRIEPSRAVLEETEGRERSVPAEAVFVMIGREAPLDFFRRSGVDIRGEWRLRHKIGLASILLATVFLYHWKTDAGIPVERLFRDHGLFPFNLSLPEDPRTLLGTLRISMRSPSFYYTLAYSLVVVLFGWRRVRRRRTPYVTVQTWTLAAIQVLPLFLLPYVVLPWMGHQGWFDHGAGKSIADAFFPVSPWDEQGREYWRAVGFILAWPLMFWNVFTDQPLTGWLAVGFAQTFVIIPAIVYVWGKGAYCGWICSCGALAETLGDTQRQKMPHGPRWNRLDMLGQGILAVAFLVLLLRVVSWMAPDGSWLDRTMTAGYMGLLLGKNGSWANLPFPLTFLNYQWLVDITLAGILGVGLYFHLSGRVWCRFACPLAALMHVYARFSRFRILADKKKCISCNVCTSVCHQGIDVMNFANKGLPMADVECVRCSACVQACPTGVLEFGQVNPRTGEVLARDRLQSSPVLMAERGPVSSKNAQDERP